MNHLKPFHPSIQNWFSSTFGNPTDVQRASWPGIAAGKHVLVTAPTGSGKTLTAFLWALDQFARGHWEPGRTRVLYISPLKALNNDIRCNLLEPLADLRAHHGFPDLRVQTRSGDTSPSQRQRMLRNPPDILITTPESLTLLLTTTRGRQALGSVETVILDEIHSIVTNRRGVQLMTAIERLVRLSGEFQRIALSATVRPLEPVARYIGGYYPDGRSRDVHIVQSSTSKAIEFRVCFPEEARVAAKNGKKIWDSLADSFRALTRNNRSTLIFTNSRRLAEKITLMINRDQLEPLAYAHHGSLAREVRTEVESRMRSGELKAIVATNSLELGIDIGHLDEVVMVQSPPSVASALQRIGRAGHQVGEVSRGTLYPTHAQDFLEAAVLATAIAARDIEPLKPLENALDVLAQIIISITANEPWPLDELFELLQCSTPYHRLPREHFDLVIEMLAGRYQGSRVRELRPRITLDRIHQTVAANRGALLALYSSGGTIPDRGYYQLRHNDTGAVLGDLDEEFVWEARVGQLFTLGTQNWQIQRITHNDVMVRAAKPGGASPPFWRSESFNRSFHFSNAIGEYLEFADALLASGQGPALKQNLQEQRGFDETSAEELLDYLGRQREASRSALPHRHHLLMEWVHTGPGGYRGPDSPRQLVLHTFWGGQLNRPWALALGAALGRDGDSAPDIHADNNTIVIQTQRELDPQALLNLVTPANLETLLRDSLETSGIFGARFRECAGRSLLLTRQRFNQRLPLWMSRLQAKKLMSATRGYSDFPVMLETWRTCLEDEFALDALSSRLGEIESGALPWSFVKTGFPSPFAASVSFEQINRYMYADDTPEEHSRSALSNDLIASAVHLEALRPKLDAGLVDAFLSKRQRTAPGYEPSGPEEWGEWLKERILLPEAEWSDALTQLLQEDNPLRIIECDKRRWATHIELIHGLYGVGLVPGIAPEAPVVEEQRSAEQLALEILTFYGPLLPAQIGMLLPCVPEGLLQQTDELLSGALLQDCADTYWCDAENFASLLRFQRASRRSQLEPRPATALPAFLASWQGLNPAGDNHPNGLSEQKLLSKQHVLSNQHLLSSQGALAANLEQLRGFSAPVKMWLDELLAPRSNPTSAALDQAAQDLGLIWFGTGVETLTFCYPEEVGFLRAQVSTCPFRENFLDPQARYSFSQVANRLVAPLEDFSEQWWASVWRGEITADSPAALRQGVQRGFKLSPRPQASARHRARARALGWQGNWQLLEQAETADALSALEDSKDHVRLLLDRYGVLTRELVNREWKWREAFRALRVMELAGEVTTGYFFLQLSGPQFASPRAVSTLSSTEHTPRHFWMCAQDPASPCGLGLDWPALPQRRVNNYLAFYDTNLALVVENAGRKLHYQVAHDHPELDAINDVLVHIAEVRRSLVVDSINGEPLGNSAYRDSLERRLLPTRDHKQTVFLPR